MAEELKPCPFCGGEAELRSANFYHWGECKQCDATGCDTVSPATACTAWNTRHPAPTEEQVEAAARAMMRFCGIDPNVFVALHGGYEHWLDDARAALEAAVRAQ